jgi:hypothetical protein
LNTPIYAKFFHFARIVDACQFFYGRDAEILRPRYAAGAGAQPIGGPVPPPLVIDKNRARIFKRINICEYKSPEDRLSVKDFYKVYAYACLYAAITPGLSLVRPRKPNRVYMEKKPKVSSVFDRN